MISPAMKDDATSSLKSSTQNFRETASAAANDAKRDIRETADKLGHKVREFVDTANTEISHATKTVNTHIHEKPLQSTLIALGVGYLLAVLTRR